MGDKIKVSLLGEPPTGAQPVQPEPYQWHRPPPPLGFVYKDQLPAAPTGPTSSQEAAKEELRKFYSNPKNAEWVDDPKERQARAERLYHLQRQALGVEEPSVSDKQAEAISWLQDFKLLGEKHPLHAPLHNPSHPGHALAVERWQKKIALAHGSEPIVEAPVTYRETTVGTPTSTQSMRSKNTSAT